jgi:hypothetical protein
MNDAENEWFSEYGNASIDVVTKLLIDHDQDVNRMLKLGISLGFGNSIQQSSEKIENRLRPMCYRAMIELHAGVDAEARTPHNLPLLTFLAFAGEVIEAIGEGDIDGAMDMLFICGFIWGEIESKYRWQSDAGRGQKVIGGARNSAQATNDRHVPLRRRRMERMVELVQDMNVTNAAYQCEVEGLGAAENVRKTWTRYKDNWDS